MEETKPLDNANKSEETHTNPQPAHNDDGYPSKKVMLPAMAALYLAVFLVSLVRPLGLGFHGVAKYLVGQDHYRHGHSVHYQRVS